MQRRREKGAEELRKITKTVAPHYVAGKGSAKGTGETVSAGNKGKTFTVGARRAPTKPQRGTGTKGAEEKEFQSFKVSES